MPTDSSQFITRPVQELLGRNPGYGFADTGVSVAIGNYTEIDADLGFPSGLLGLLDWVRTYNSLTSAAGVPGRGWSTSFGVSLTTQQGSGDQARGTVQFHDTDDRVLTFTPDGTGRFTRASVSSTAGQGPDR